MRKEDPFHTILDSPWEYDIVSLGYYRHAISMTESFIDLILRRGDTLVHLRFHDPQELEVEKGFPDRTGGLCIYDVSARGMERIGVRVGDFEASRGAVRFWARDVVKVGEHQITGGAP